MKKVVLLSLTLLGACSGYDYYKTDVRYRQSGTDCVYYYNEKGAKFNRDIDSVKDAKKVVYRDTMCRDLYMRDTFGYAERNDRKAIVPVTVEGKKTTSCGCSQCAKKEVLKSRFVIVPAFEG